MENLSELLLGCLAVSLVGVSKGGFGGSLGGLAVPLLAVYMDPVAAAAVMLPLLCTMDVLGVVQYRRYWRWALFRPLAAGAVFGLAAGSLVFGHVNPEGIRLLVGLTATAFSISPLLLRRLALPDPPGSRHPLRGAVFGGVAGFTSFIAHAGGPPLQMHLLPMRLPRSVFQGTTVLFFAAINYSKLLPYAWTGSLTGDTLRTSLILLPVAPVAFALGVWLHRRVDDRLFYRLSYSALFLVGVKLCWDAAAELLG